MDPPTSNSHSGLSIKLNDLPPEIRELIWEFTLPDCRVFHVDYFCHQKNTTYPEQREMYFKFHIDHKPPTTTRVCAESRTVALRKGFFLSSHDDHPGFWFNPDKDVLYFDRNHRRAFYLKPNQPRMIIPGWDRVLNVGLEWRAFFRDIPHPAQDETMASYWKAAIKPMCSYMPRVKTFNYILPRVRSKGGVTWGREPYGAQDYEAELVSLPDNAAIPWETRRNMGTMQTAQWLTHEIHGARVPAPSVVSWQEVRKGIERGFEEMENEDNGGLERGANESQCAEQAFHSPQVKGCWLVRPNLPLADMGNPGQMMLPESTLERMS